MIFWPLGEVPLRSVCARAACWAILPPAPEKAHPVEGVLKVFELPSHFSILRPTYKDYNGKCLTYRDGDGDGECRQDDDRFHCFIRACVTCGCVCSEGSGMTCETIRAGIYVISICFGDFRQFSGRRGS